MSKRHCFQTAMCCKIYSPFETKFPKGGCTQSYILQPKLLVCAISAIYSKTQIRIVINNDGKFPHINSSSTRIPLLLILAAPVLVKYQEKLLKLHHHWCAMFGTFYFILRNFFLIGSVGTSSQLSWIRVMKMSIFLDLETCKLHMWKTKNSLPSLNWHPYSRQRVKSDCAYCFHGMENFMGLSFLTKKAAGGSNHKAEKV